MHIANGTKGGVTARRPVYGARTPRGYGVRDRGPGLVEEPHAPARDETSTAEAAQTHVSNRNRVNYRVVRDDLRTSGSPRGARVTASAQSLCVSYASPRALCS